MMDELITIEEELQSRKRNGEKRHEAKEAENLTNGEIARYSRQLLLPEFGVGAQKRLKSSSALIVGAGGLGCPCAQYLVAAGVGRVGIVDHDCVDKSNLHRQVLHSESGIGAAKAVSVAAALSDLNSDVEVVAIVECLTSANALEIMKEYDVVLDATDNVATRYLLNDACVLLKKTLVSGSALRFEGQLTVYNYRETGPTYRCLFPTPPPPETVTNCSDGGVLGVIPGTIGVLQALEAIKVLAGLGDVLSGRLLLFDGLAGTFRTVKLRPRKVEAVESISELVDYVQFCGAGANDKDEPLKIVAESDRMSALELSSTLKSPSPSLVVDVRSEPEIEICSVPGTVSVPLNRIRRPGGKGEMMRLAKEAGVRELVLLCRRGNDSQVAASELREAMAKEGVRVRDVAGGLHAWARDVDKDFPVY